MGAYFTPISFWSPLSPREIQIPNAKLDANRRKTTSRLGRNGLPDVVDKLLASVANTWALNPLGVGSIVVELDFG